MINFFFKAGAVFQVHGAGSVEVNGYYKQMGEHKDKPRYHKVGQSFVIVMLGERGGVGKRG